MFIHVQRFCQKKHKIHTSQLVLREIKEHADFLKFLWMSPVILRKDPYMLGVLSVQEKRIRGGIIHFIANQCLSLRCGLHRGESFPAELWCRIFNSTSVLRISQSISHCDHYNIKIKNGCAIPFTRWTLWHYEAGSCHSFMILCSSWNHQVFTRDYFSF